jgi:hypothetical protein
MYFEDGACPSHKAQVRGAILTYSPGNAKCWCGSTPQRKRMAGIFSVSVRIFIMCVFYCLWLASGEERKIGVRMGITGAEGDNHGAEGEY